MINVLFLLFSNLSVINYCEYEISIYRDGKEKHYSMNSESEEDFGNNEKRISLDKSSYCILTIENNDESISPSFFCDYVGSSFTAYDFAFAEKNNDARKANFKARFFVASKYLITILSSCEFRE